MGFLIQIHLEDSEILILTFVFVSFFLCFFGISNGFKFDAFCSTGIYRIFCLDICLISVWLLLRLSERIKERCKLYGPPMKLHI